VEADCKKRNPQGERRQGPGEDVVLAGTKGGNQKKLDRRFGKVGFATIIKVFRTLVSLTKRGQRQSFRRAGLTYPNDENQITKVFSKRNTGVCVMDSYIYGQLGCGLCKSGKMGKEKKS